MSSKVNSFIKSKLLERKANSGQWWSEGQSLRTNDYLLNVFLIVSFASQISYVTRPTVAFHRKGKETAAQVVPMDFFYY